ncbi:MAG: ATP-binding protein [Bacteroidia bacterium]
MHESITVKTGLSFFSDLCQFFCRTLNVKYACIGRVSRKENTVYTLAFTEKDTIKDNFVFQIENTPTEKVINFEGFSYNGNVQDVFKKDKTLRDFSIASYLGFPIVDENSDPIGIVSLMNDKQIENTAYCEEILGLVFTRISNEISRINFENKLQESEAFNKGVLSSLNSEIAVLDKNGNILMVNDAWIKFGKENGKPGQRNVENHGVGSNYFEVCKKAIKNGDKDAKNVLDGVIKVADGRLGQFQYEFECSSPEEKRFFLMTANLFKGAESRVVLRYINITERKINESKLENSEKKYRLLVENSKELIFSMDKSGDISFANEAFFQALNLNASTKVNLFDFLHSRKTVITSLFSVNKERDSKELLQFELKTMDDTIVYLEGVIHVPIIENKVTEIQFYMTDRTQLRLAEIELQKSQKDYKTVVQNLNDAVVLKNKNSEILFFNTSYQKMIKEQDENNINKKNWFDFVADGWKYEIKKEYDDLYKSDIHDKTIEYEGLKSDNTSFWIEEKISTIMDESGNLIGTLSVIRDISEIKKQDLQLKKVVKDLNNRYNEMQQFNYIISHNLRAPISNILGLVNILSNQSTDDNELKIYIEYLKNSATKIDEVIKDLNLILNTKKSLDVERESVNIKLAIEGIIGIFQAQINTIKADIKFTITNEISKFYTIKSYFESIIYNLLSNAIKYRSNKRKLIITIDVFQKDNDLVIIVRDNGLGIDLEKNKHSLFGLYKRFNNSVEGKGLGLHMTKNQIEALGGTISVESQEDKGVTFTIQLPLKRINM